MYSTCSSASCSAALLISIAKAKLGSEFGQRLTRGPYSAFGFVPNSFANGRHNVTAVLFLLGK